MSAVRSSLSGKEVENRRQVCTMVGRHGNVTKVVNRKMMVVEVLLMCIGVISDSLVFSFYGMWS